MNKYFAASNSAQGFYSYYNECFGDADKLYIIKGGPGTGKSGFMKRCGVYASGKGYKVEYFYCSSDPDSLDGVIIYKGSRKIAIIDGTSPHSCDLVYPGVRDNIINLGDSWDECELDKSREEIFSLSEKKTEAYRVTYNALRSCGNLLTVADACIGKFLCRDKLEATAMKLVEKINPSGNRKSQVRLVDSVSMKGRVRFDTFERKAGKCVIIGDTYGTGHAMLYGIKRALDKCGGDYFVSYDPVCPTRINGIFEISRGVSFLLSDSRIVLSDDGKIHYVNMKRFINKDATCMREELKYTMSLYKSCMELAVKHLEEASKHHFSLEEIYKRAMDFSSVNRKIEDFCAKVL